MFSSVVCAMSGIDHRDTKQEKEREKPSAVRNIETQHVVATKYPSWSSFTSLNVGLMPYAHGINWICDFFRTIINRRGQKFILDHL